MSSRNIFHNGLSSCSICIAGKYAPEVNTQWPIKYSFKNSSDSGYTGVYVKRSEFNYKGILKIVGALTLHSKGNLLNHGANHATGLPGLDVPVPPVPPEPAPPAPAVEVALPI